MDEISLNRLSTMCRLCLASSVTMSDIFAFSTKMSNQLIANVIMSCAPVKITRCDGMPNFICQLCFTQLKKSHQFQMQIIESDETLRRYLQQLRASDKEIKTSREEPSDDPLIYDTIAHVTVKCEPAEFLDVFDVGRSIDDKSLLSTEGVSELSFRNVCSEISCDDTNTDLLTKHLNVNSKEKEAGKFYSADKINVEVSSKFEHQADNIENNQIKSQCSVQGPSENPVITDKCDSLNFPYILDMKVKSKEKMSANVCSTNQTTENKSYKSGIKNERVDDNFIFLPEYAEGTVEITENVDERQKRTNNVFSRNHEKCTNANTKELNQSYKCEICSKCFTVSSHLNDHKREHTNEKASYNFKCNKRIHTDEKPYQCDVCSKCFTSKNINTHKRTHTGEKPYQCDFCDKSFRQSNNLKRHRRTHTGEKPYHCDVCSRCFTTSSNLNDHKRTHTGERPHKCDLCNKCFPRLDSLNIHKRAHKGEKPYRCDVCTKCFTTSSNLNDHKRTHTGEKPYKCDLCNMCFTHSNSLSRHKASSHS